jgi:hypothetical protein
MGNRPRNKASVLDRGKAGALFYGCTTVEEAQKRYEELYVNPLYANPHARQLLLGQLQKTRLRIYDDEAARMRLLGQGVAKATDLATLVSVLQSTDPNMLAAALDQVSLQARKKADKAAPKPVEPPQEPETPSEPSKAPVEAPEPAEEVQEAEEQAEEAEDDGWEWSNDPKRSPGVTVKSVEMPDAGKVASAAPVSDGVDLSRIEQEAQAVVDDVQAAVHFPLGAGQRYYPQQWAFFSDDEKWDNCISFLSDIGGRSGLNAAVVRREIHAHHAAEVLTLRDRKKSQAGKKGYATRKANAAK